MEILNRLNSLYGICDREAAQLLGFMDHTPISKYRSGMRQIPPQVQAHMEDLMTLSASARRALKQKRGIKIKDDQR